MNFQWNEHTITWFARASTYTQYHEKLAQFIRPLLGDSQTLCDIGCGLGLLDLALAPSFPVITCLDNNDAALSFLNLRAQELGLTNIYTSHQDAALLRGQWDTAILSFFGSIDLLRFLPYCRKMISIVDDVEIGHISLNREGQRRNNAATVEEKLQENGRIYKIHRMALEFGQPFVSQEEAAWYAAVYAPQRTTAEIHDDLRDRLEETTDSSYPFYLPHLKHLAIIEIAGDLP